MAEFQIQSINTKFYVINTNGDADGQKVATSPNPPGDSTLTVNPGVKEEPIPQVITITGAKKLYVALQNSAEGTFLTWSEREYQWVINPAPGPDGYLYVTPASGQDLYWFDEFSSAIGNHVIVTAGKNIKPPQSQWKFIPVLE